MWALCRGQGHWSPAKKHRKWVNPDNFGAPCDIRTSAWLRRAFFSFQGTWHGICFTTVSTDSRAHRWEWRKHPSHKNTTALIDTTAKKTARSCFSARDVSFKLRSYKHMQRLRAIVKQNQTRLVLKTYGFLSLKLPHFRRFLASALLRIKVVFTGRAKKSNPLGKIRYLWNCCRFFRQI